MEHIRNRHSLKPQHRLKLRPRLAFEHDLGRGGGGMGVRLEVGMGVGLGVGLERGRGGSGTGCSQREGHAGGCGGLYVCVEVSGNVCGGCLIMINTGPGCVR